MKHILRIFILSGILLFGCHSGNNNQHYTGIVEGKVYTVSSVISDQLMHVNVSEGDHVQKNQVLAIIDTTDIHLQLEQSKSALRQLEIQINNANIQLSQAKTNLRYFTELYQKNLPLSKTNAIPVQKLQDIRLQMENATHQLDLAKENIRLLSEKKQQAQYQIQLLQEKRSKAILRAPADGIIDNIFVEESEIPAPLSPIMEIVHLDEVWCYIYLPEVDLSGIQIGQKVRVLADGHSEALEGTIVHVNKQAEFTPKNIMTPDNRQALVYGVKVVIPNKDHILKPGMPVQVEWE
ncbi:MAG: efflux RND transporter periplasmic adaptor subunit [Calditrichia bacterium]